MQHLQRINQGYQSTACRQELDFTKLLSQKLGSGQEDELGGID